MVTPEAAFEPLRIWPSQEEIAAALQTETALNNFPLSTDTVGSPWKELYGWFTNPRIIDLVIAERFEISVAYDLYYDSNNAEAKLSVPLYAYDRVEQRFIILTTGSTWDGRIPPEEFPSILNSIFGDNDIALNKRIASIKWQKFENYRPPHYKGGIGQPDFVALLHEALGVTEEDIDHFIQTGDPSRLPMIDGERWLFPNQISGSYFDQEN